jgi:hypothetical protein
MVGGDRLKRAFSSGYILIAEGTRVTAGEWGHRGSVATALDVWRRLGDLLFIMARTGHAQVNYRAQVAC